MERRRTQRARTEEILDVGLDLFGQPFHTHLAVPTGTMRLAEVVPIARRLCDRLVSFVLLGLREIGRDVPCQVGCSACCRYLVPLSPPEAFALLEEIQALPPARRARTLEAFRAARRKLHEAALAPRQDSAPRAGGPSAPLTKAERWYAHLELDCPFLAHNLCSAYSWRPLACRSYFAVSDARYCGDLSTGLGRRLRMPVSFVQALGDLTAELEGSEHLAVALPIAPLWAAGQPRRAARHWPARDVMGRLVRILHDQAVVAAVQTRFEDAA